MMDRRAALRVTLGFLALEPREPELRRLHRCFDKFVVSATSSPAWLAKATTWNFAATTAKGGARCPSLRDLNTR
jgi:hypothetical protein